MNKKVTVELKKGKKIEVYEGEKYRLWKKGLIKSDKKQDEKYTEQKKAEKPKRANVALQGTQIQRLDIRVSKLEKGGGDGYDDTELKEAFEALKKDNETLLGQIGELEAKLKALEPKK